MSVVIFGLDSLAREGARGDRADDGRDKEQKEG